MVILLAVTSIAALGFRWQINSPTAGFTFLILVLAAAARWGLRESITTSVLSVAAYNFVFLPPIGTFTIADPQNWFAFFAFLAAAVTASRLSSKARQRAEEASARQQELERMYDFSRGLTLGKEDYLFSQQIVKQIAESFQVQDAWFYDSLTEKITKFDGTRVVFEESVMAQVAGTRTAWSNPAGTVLAVPVRLGNVSSGSLAIVGEAIPSEIALQAIAQLVAIAIEKARVQEISARIEMTKQNEQLKSTLLDALAHEFKTPLTSVKAVTTTLLSSSLNAADQRDQVTIGPTNQKLYDRVKASADQFRKENPTYTGPIPSDALTASASGLDPQISVANAEAQTERVAKARNMDKTSLQRLIASVTEKRDLAFLGEPRVNVLKLNLQLDREFPKH